MACAAQPAAGTYQANCEEAHALISSPDLIGGTVVSPSTVTWTSDEEFEFPSAITSPWPENNVVYAKLQKCSENWQGKPTVILIHGWNDEWGYALRHPYQAKRFLKAGINVAMIELPYHLKRRPRRAGAVNDFLSEDLRSTVLAAKQAVMDIRMLLAWLREQGCRETGLLGVSLGGWLTGLVATHDANVSFAILNVPVSRMDRVVNELAFTEPIRRSLLLAEAKRFTINFDHLNLRSFQPKPPLDRILIIEAVDDLFASKEAIEEFWAAWGNPEIWRVRHAHITGLFSPFLLNRQVKWLAAKLNGRGNL